MDSEEEMDESFRTGARDRTRNARVGWVLLLAVSAAFTGLLMVATRSAFAVEGTAGQGQERVSELDGAWSSGATDEVDGTGVPIHHYSEASQGEDTVIEFPGNIGMSASGEVQAAESVSWVPFAWTIDFDSTLNGRLMKSSTGVFCQRFKSNYNHSTMRYIQITLWRRVQLAPNVPYATKNFRATGVWSERKCWAQHDASKTYYFHYNVRPGFNGTRVIGQGYASK